MLQEFTRARVSIRNRESFSSSEEEARGIQGLHPHVPILSMERGFAPRTNTIFSSQVSNIRPTSNVKLYIYIYPGEDNPVLSALDSQRLCRLLEDLLFRSTSFLLPPPAPPLPRFPFTQTRRRVPTNYPPFSSSRKLVTRLYSSFPGESPARNNSRGMEG